MELRYSLCIDVFRRSRSYLQVNTRIAEIILVRPSVRFQAWRRLSIGVWV